MDKNFKIRWIVGMGMFLVALVGLYTFESVPFKIIYLLFALVAMVELFSFFRRKVNVVLVLLTLVETAFLICSVIFVCKVSLNDFWYIILGVCGYDIFAYLFGRAFGGKVFKKSRPFPAISKNKTWEGTVLGLAASLACVGLYMHFFGELKSDAIYFLCGPLALIGDLFESFLKRRFGVKDSNEILIKRPFFRKLEMLVGGSEGHGGFLDRIDSTAFAATILLIIILINGGF